MLGLALLLAGLVDRICRIPAWMSSDLFSLARDSSRRRFMLTGGLHGHQEMPMLDIARQ